MADKLNIYLDVSNLSIVGDEFRYKYSYEEIVYMIENITLDKNDLQGKFDRMQSKLDVIEADLTTATSNLIMLNAIKDAIEEQDPSLYATEENPPIEEPPVEEPPVWEPSI